jgi:mRNA interferase MazF
MTSRGEIWWVNLNPTRGHAQAGTRPALIVSTDVYNHGPAQLVLAAPLTTRDRRIPLWVAIEPPEGGLRERSLAMCDAFNFD